MIIEIIFYFQDMSIAGDFPCKICIMDTQLKDMVTLQQCSCMFCKEVRRSDLHYFIMHVGMSRVTYFKMHDSDSDSKLSPDDSDSSHDSKNHDS